MLILAAIFLAATLVLYISGAHRQSRQIKVFVEQIPKQPEAQVTEATKYLREACPDIAVTRDEHRADFGISAFWRGTAWVVVLKSRSEAWPLLFFKQDSPDALETFRQGCVVIRDNAKDMAEFEARSTALPTGRYVLHSSTPDRLFLLDTATGAVWELKPQPLKDRDQFEPIDVEGLYRHMY